MSTIEMNDLNHVLKLARLSVPESEKASYLKKLQDVLDTMAVMDNLPIDQLPPSTHAVSEETSLREDVSVNYGDLQLESNAPDWDAPSHSFGVPKMS